MLEQKHDRFIQVIGFDSIWSSLWQKRPYHTITIYPLNSGKTSWFNSCPFRGRGARDTRETHPYNFFYLSPSFLLLLHPRFLLPARAPSRVGEGQRTGMRGGWGEAVYLPQQVAGGAASGAAGRSLEPLAAITVSGLHHVSPALTGLYLVLRVVFWPIGSAAGTHFSLCRYRYHSIISWR